MTIFIFIFKHKLNLHCVVRKPKNCLCRYLKIDVELPQDNTRMSFD